MSLSPEFEEDYRKVFLECNPPLPIEHINNGLALMSNPENIIRGNTAVTNKLIKRLNFWKKHSTLKDKKAIYARLVQLINERKSS